MHSIKNHIALHSTDYLTPYLSLLARVEGIEPQQLYDDLNIKRKVLRMRMFRGTLFIINKEDPTPLIGALKMFSEHWLHSCEKYFIKNNVGVEQLLTRVHELFAKKNFLTTRELKSRIPVAGSEDFMVFMRYLEFKGVLIRGSQQHLNDRVIKYGMLEEWMPQLREREDGSDI